MAGNSSARGYHLAPPPPSSSASHGVDQLHLYLFHIGEVVFGDPDPDWDTEVMDSTSTSLQGVIRSGIHSFVYEYDLGDSWEHEITVQKVLEGEQDVVQPICTDGA